MGSLEHIEAAVMICAQVQMFGEVFAI